MMRAYTEEWQIVAQHDLRRGVWFREERDAGGNLLAVEICAGREGDDEFVRIERGDLSPEKFTALHSILECGVYARDLNGLPTSTQEQREQG